MKKNYDKKVNQHYDKVANKQKKSKFSTMEDEYIRDQETDFIINIIKNDKKKLNILDSGCGNGYTLDQISEALEIFDGQSLMIEKFVNFKMEVSVIASRSTSGEIKTYPLVENIHKNNILEMTIAPARINEIISKNAEEIAHKTMEVLHGAGVFGIEMFVTNDNEILINEIAPRVHNSGHHTLQSSKTSQFEQHLRAILGLKLGSTELVHPTIMYNILGPKDFIGKFKNPTTDLQNVFLKMYGKSESKPQRKIGHVNVVDKNNLGMEKLLEQVSIVSESIKIISE